MSNWFHKIMTIVKKYFTYFFEVDVLAYAHLLVAHLLVAHVLVVPLPTHMCSLHMCSYASQNFAMTVTIGNACAVHASPNARSGWPAPPPRPYELWWPSTELPHQKP